MKKWTKAERERASREGKARWAARKLRDTRQSDVVTWPIGGVRVEAGNSGGGGSTGANASSGGAASLGGERTILAIDIVAMLRDEAIPSPTLVKVVERILRP